MKLYLSWLFISFKSSCLWLQDVAGITEVFGGSLATQISAEAVPALFDCVMENRLLCGFLILCSFSNILHFLTRSHVMCPACKLWYIWPTVNHSLVAYSRAELCLALALAVRPGSVLNYGWHIRLCKPWLHCQDLMFTIELFRILNVSGPENIFTEKNKTLFPTKKLNSSLSLFCLYSRWNTRTWTWVYLGENISQQAEICLSSGLLLHRFQISFTNLDLSFQLSVWKYFEFLSVGLKTRQKLVDSICSKCQIFTEYSWAFCCYFFSCLSISPLLVCLALLKKTLAM